MNKLIFVLIIIILGAGLWFYLLIGKDSSKEKPVVEDEQTEVREEPEVIQIQVDATTTAEYPLQSDAGMEFPTLEY
jgi:hypothetical protein